MDRENLKNIVRVINETINKRLTESAVDPFPNKREAILAILDVIDGTMTQKNFINQLLSAKRAGKIDEKNVKLILGQLRTDAKDAGVELEQIIDRLIDKYQSGSNVFNESKKLSEAPIPGQPLAPTQPAPVAPAIPTPVATTPAPAGIDPAWKLDMVEFLGNSFAGMAKQFLYQAKKANPNGTADQISQLANELQKSGQISELFKTRFLTALSAAI